MNYTTESDSERPLDRSGSLRSGLLETIIVVFLTVMIALVCWQAWQNMRAEGVVDNFSVLFSTTSWDLSSSVLPHSPEYPYWRTLLVAYGNTLIVAIPVIALSTVGGGIIGVARVGSNLALSGFARAFVDLFRNVPVLLQISFWYAVLLNAPTAAEALHIGNFAYLTNRGVFFVEPQLQTWATLVICACVVLQIFCIWPRGSGRKSANPPRRNVRKYVLLATLGLIVATLLMSDHEVPVRAGFSFRGGGEVSIEFVALLLGLSVYGAAFVAEIVRGALNSVPKGQIEAAQSLGLPDWVTFWKVKAPLSLRLMILPLSNQYLFLVKGTGLGLAIGFAEAFQVTVTSINQTGKSIDFLLIMVASFFVINFTIARLMALINKRIAIPYASR